MNWRWCFGRPDADTRDEIAIRRRTLETDCEIVLGAFQVVPSPRSGIVGGTDCVAGQRVLLARTQVT